MDVDSGKKCTFAQVLPEFYCAHVLPELVTIAWFQTIAGGYVDRVDSIDQPGTDALFTLRCGALKNRCGASYDHLVASKYSLDVRNVIRGDNQKV